MSDANSQMFILLYKINTNLPFFVSSSLNNDIFFNKRGEKS